MPYLFPIIFLFVVIRAFKHFCDMGYLALTRASPNNIGVIIQCNLDIRESVSGPKLEPVLRKQNRPNPDIRETGI